MVKTKLPIALCLAIIALAATARAQQQPADDQPAQQAPEPALSGPAVEQIDRPTLVVYVYGGELRELDLPPAEAALDLIDLDELTQEKVAVILAARAELAERLIIENFDFVSQGETIEASGNKLAQAGFLLRVIQLLQPLIQRGSLEDEVRAALPDEAAREYDRILEEYWDALARSRLATSDQRVTRQKVRREVRKAKRDQLGKEVELAATRAVESERFAVTYLMKELDLSESQERLINGMVTDFVASHMGEASEKEREKLFVQIIAFLNEKQRDILARRIRELQ